MLYRGRVLRRSALALASGAVLVLAFPAYGLWWLAPVAVAGFALATTGVRVRDGAWLGLLTGLAFFAPTLSWAGTDFLGVVPWLGLAALQALFISALGAVGAGVQGSGVSPLAVALSWVGSEALRDRIPYGGFPWVRLAFSQADAPSGRLAALGGAPMVTFAVALTGGLLAMGIRYAAEPGPSSGRAGHASRKPNHRPGPGQARGGRYAVAGFALAGCLVVIGWAVPVPTEGPTARVMAVQGNVPRPGLDFNAERRQVLDNHVEATLAGLAAARAAGEPDPELVVWPENASDIDPTRNADAEAQIRRATDVAGVPLVIGGLLDEPAPLISNVSLMYRPGVGLVQTYVKQHPVPFAEYIPDRAFFRRFSASVDLVRNELAAGPGPGVFHVDRGSGSPPLEAGATICFEVAYDELVRGTVRAGANLLLVQTNNATFGYSHESQQQLAISRIRAIEHGRAVVHVSTVGVSALVWPDGTVRQPTALYTAATLRGDLPLRTATTLATRLGPWPEYVAGVALLLMVARALVRRRTERTPSSP